MRRSIVSIILVLIASNALWADEEFQSVSFDGQSYTVTVYFKEEPKDPRPVFLFLPPVEPGKPTAATYSVTVHAKENSYEAVVAPAGIPPGMPVLYTVQVSADGHVLKPGDKILYGLSSGDYEGTVTADGAGYRIKTTCTAPCYILVPLKPGPFKGSSRIEGDQVTIDWGPGQEGPIHPRGPEPVAPPRSWLFDRISVSGSFLAEEDRDFEDAPGAVLEMGWLLATIESPDLQIWWNVDVNLFPGVHVETIVNNRGTLMDVEDELDIFYAITGLELDWRLCPVAVLVLAAGGGSFFGSDIDEDFIARFGLGCLLELHPGVAVRAMASLVEKDSTARIRQFEIDYDERAVQFIVGLDLKL